VSELLLEATVVDYWRNAKALEYEMKYLSPRGGEFHPQCGMPGLQRYLTANRNALRKDLELLEQPQTSPAEAAEAKTADDGLADSETEDNEEADAA
jgi:hypothetical protein